MIKVNYFEVMNIDNALRGMRNPMESWDKRDSCYKFIYEDLVIGEKDMDLAKKLILAGTDHSKFMRQIFVSMDIIAPDYWWKEMDTYKVGTTANSTSTMHKISSRLLTQDDFSIDNWDVYNKDTLNYLNSLIAKYQETKDKEVWRKLIQALPMSYNYLRTWTGSFTNLRNMYFARKNHKLSEWKEFCKVIEGLPYYELITVEK